MKRILRMAGAVMVCMALGFATVGTDIQTVYAQEEVRGAGAQTADGWSYETNSNGTLTITGYSGTETKVTVPATIGGKSVSGIGNSAFYNNKVLEEVTVSEGIQSIGQQAFSMSALRKLWLPASLNTFKDGEDVCELEGIYVDSASQYYRDVDGILYNKNMTTLVKYPSKKTASTFTVPDGVTELADCSMDSNTSLRKVVLPDSLKTVGYWSFINCSNLSDITLPEQCTFVGQYAFSGTALTSFYIPAALETLMSGTFLNTDISSITVSPQNTTFYIDGKDGLYKHDQSVFYPANGNQSHRGCETLVYYYGDDAEYTILDGTITISMFAIELKNNLKKLVMPDSLQTLETSWIQGCCNLEEVYLSPSLSIVDNGSYTATQAKKVYGYETTENHAVADKLISNGTGGTFVSRGTPYTVTYYGPGANSSYKTYTMGTLRKPVWIETRSDCTYRYYYTDGTGSRKEITSWPVTISQNMEVTIETGSGKPDSNDSGNDNTVQNGWKEENGAKYWYENGVKQGTEGRGKEIYDPSSDAWYWLDAPDGKMAVSKDVYQESLAGDWGDIMGADGNRYGKWVRYDENGHMIKGWQATEAGVYYFDPTYGTMAKGAALIDGVSYYFDPQTGIRQDTTGWITVDGVDYWYENGIRQGYDPYNENYRGKEIYDPSSDAWYWLDNVQQGAKAVGKDVYQESAAGDWGDSVNESGEKVGKWVRYDGNGYMVKGWQTNEAGTYYFDPTYGTMAKGQVEIDGVSYYFDPTTGIKQ
ncbi:leucine-rich repeat protein [Roseburia hominis]|uniref:leucine-rich repeat protein n=1 Tax=Roseburia hominis TaxID=301301 RepID=UPI0026EB9C39|nr:leucine-rich repeat protein [Roseburia hominis]MCI7522676.1 leucine-rich repeat protein [Roseburia hominis]